MGRDELGNCGDGVFFFLGFGDDNVRVGGVSASYASKLKFRVWLFFFVRGSVYSVTIRTYMTDFIYFCVLILES